jgi:hypothetical protein
VVAVSLEQDHCIAKKSSVVDRKWHTRQLMEPPAEVPSPPDTLLGFHHFFWRMEGPPAPVCQLQLWPVVALVLTTLNED